VRICAVDVRNAGWEELECVVGTSDSAVKLWRYRALEGEKWECVGTWTYGSSCILHTNFLMRRLVVVAGTDGVLCTLDIVRGEWSWKRKAHQSAVKALTIIRDGAGKKSWRVYTGGDDCALACTEIEVEEDEVVTSSVRVVNRAHASAVTAVVVAGQRVFTAGPDMRLRAWQKEGMQLLEVRDTGVADACGMILGPSGRVVVAGVGTEVWRVQSEFN